MPRSASPGPTQDLHDGVEARISVVGDGGVGKTQLCHRLQYGPSWEVDSAPPCSAKQEFYFCHRADMWHCGEQAVTAQAMTSANQHQLATTSVVSSKSQQPDGDWSDAAAFDTNIVLKLVEPSGVDRSSLQHIIFRNMVGLVVVMDCKALWEEFLASDSAPLDESEWIAHMERQRCGEVAMDSWQTYASESILFWVRTAMIGSRFYETHPSGVQPPVVVAISRTDLVLSSAPLDTLGHRHARRAEDGATTSWARFTRMMTFHCCGELSALRLADEIGSVAVVDNRATLRKSRSERRSTKQPPLVKSSVGHSNWFLDISNDDPKADRLKCDAVFFVSSVREVDCPHRTHQIVNTMVNLCAARALPRALQTANVKKKRSNGETNPRRRCCADS